MLRGTGTLPARIRLGPATGTTIRARFGPLDHPALAAGRDVSGGPGPDIALGLPGGGPGDEGEVWILRDPGVSGVLTLGALGPRGVRLLGGRESFGAGSDVAFVGDQTGDGRADLLVGASEEEFAGRPRAGTVYTYAAGAAPGPALPVRGTGSGRVRGTDLGDVLTGSPGPDRMVGFEGGDCLRGLGGRRSPGRRPRAGPAGGRRRGRPPERRPGPGLPVRRRRGRPPARRRARGPAWPAARAATGSTPATAPATAWTPARATTSSAPRTAAATGSTAARAATRWWPIPGTACGAVSGCAATARRSTTTEARARPAPGPRSASPGGCAAG